MARSTVARLASAMVVFLAALAAAVPVAAQSEPRITICQATGSPATPWVFTTIDARDLPEHLARGDFRANSIADCSAGGTPAATPAAAPAEQPQRAGILPADASLSQPEATATPTPAAAPASAAATPSPTATVAPASSPPPSAVNVAGAQATREPEVSTLPPGGDEPDRPLLVLILLGLFAAGFGLWRLGVSRAES
jgi:hypothetical protein